MEPLTELYRDVILDHGKRPRNFGRLAGATHSADGDNPLCGDRIHVDLALAGDTVTDVRFEASGCAIATASASLMTESLTGRTRDEARALVDRVEVLCTAGIEDGDPQTGDALALFRAVRHYPLRVTCARLPWHTMRRALGI